MWTLFSYIFGLLNLWNVLKILIQYLDTIRTKPVCSFWKRSVMITQEMCPIRAEISTHKHLGKCIYLLFVRLAVIGFRQNYFYILPNFGDFGAKMSFFLYIINQKQNNFIKHCSPPCTKKPLISEMCIYIKSSLCIHYILIVCTTFTKKSIQFGNITVFGYIKCGKITFRLRRW